MYIYIYAYYIHMCVSVYIIYIYKYILNNSKKIKLSFKYSEFHVNYFTIFSLLTTLSTDVTKSLQCKGIFLSNAI